MLPNIFDTFSKRNQAASSQRQHEIPATTRNRVVYWLSEVYTDTAFGNLGVQFWREIYRRMIFRTGRMALSDSRPSTPSERQAVEFVIVCSGPRFLDFIEDIFSVPQYTYVESEFRDLIAEVNEILCQDNLPYYVTDFIHETLQLPNGTRTTFTEATPKVVMKESETLHKNAIEPALQLLKQSHFRTANQEFLAALEDYRRGDIQDCLTKCSSAFESTLKIICDRKGWPYNDTDTAKTLIEVVLPRTTLGTYFQSVLQIVATLRNKLSSAHGAGVSAKDPRAHIAHYALNATASAILLLTEETGI